MQVPMSYSKDGVSEPRLDETPARRFLLPIRRSTYHSQGLEMRLTGVPEFGLDGPMSLLFPQMAGGQSDVRIGE